MKMIDCFCGLGGVSDGFALEGFDVLGIDIEDMPSKGYKHKFLQADIRTLQVSDLPVVFRKPKVIWGSPPCRNFSIIAKTLGHRWKNPPDIQQGLKLVSAFRRFVKDAGPEFWIMENVWLLRDYYETPRFIAPLGKHMHRAFWGNFPAFLLPRTNKVLTDKLPNGKMTHFKGRGNHGFDSWVRAKIPLPCSRAFAKACKQSLTFSQKHG